VGNGGGGSAFVQQYLAGDAFVAGEGARPVFGADVMHGGNADGSDGYAVVENFMVGDLLVFDGAGGMKFASDTMYGGSGSGGDGYAINIMVGDNGYQVGDALPHSLGAFTSEDPFAALAATQHDASTDTVVSRVPEVYAGDKMYGGNDQAFNIMEGDASVLFQGDKGGADLLVAGTGINTYNQLIGDANWIQAGAIGGNDTLVSGMGQDFMWGDAFERDGTGGADMFVFAPGNNDDTIEDFQIGIDKINLVAFRADVNMSHTFRALMNSGRVEQWDNGVFINTSDSFGHVADSEPSDGILIIGVTVNQLSTATFLF
jgi:hypothetical protein